MVLTRKGNQIWFREDLYSDIAQEILVSEIIVEKQTKFQNLLILRTPRYGKILVLDNVVQIAEEDEYIYHEAIVHCSLFSHPQPRRVLIIGGGDGGALRETLKHKEVEIVDLVEIDEEVVNLCREHFPEISQGAFDNSRVRLTINDGAEFIKSKSDEYDIVIVDSPDPIGPAEVLFKTEFYKNLYQCLKDGGIVIRQTGSLILQPSECPSSFCQMKEVFNDVRVFLIPMASYIGGNFTLTAGLKGERSFKEIEENVDRFKSMAITTKWYSPKIHFSAMTLPPDFRKRLAEEKYGEELILDLYGCEHSILASVEKVVEWSKKTCGVIKMKPFGEPFASDFGHNKNKTAGPSVVQLIETSSIVAHYSPHWLLACANIFTCVELNAKEAIKFTMDFFKAQRAVCIIIPRGFFKNLEDLKKEIKILEINRGDDFDDLKI